MTEEDLEEAIWALPYEKGVTNTAEGLLHAQQIIERTSRASVKVGYIQLFYNYKNLANNVNLIMSNSEHYQCRSEALIVFLVHYGTKNLGLMFTHCALLHVLAHGCDHH